MIRRFEMINGALVEIFDEINNRNKITDKLYLKLMLCLITSIIMLYVGRIVHEFFHLIMLVYFGINEVKFYAGTDRGYVEYIWTDELTVEERLIVSMSGSLGTIILFLLIMIYLYSKDKMLGLIPIMRILCELQYWYDGGNDCQNYIKYNPTINFMYVNNLFLGLLILGYSLMITLFIVIIYDAIRQLQK